MTEKKEQDILMFYVKPCTAETVAKVAEDLGRALEHGCFLDFEISISVANFERRVAE